MLKPVPAWATRALLIALAMVASGADRIGASASVKIVGGGDPVAKGY